MEFFDLFESDSEKHAREKRELMQMSEKELLAEILLELRRINYFAENIHFHQIFNDNKK